MTKLFARWIFCIRENCPESRRGKCQRAIYEESEETVKGYPAEFPKDGKCLFPAYIEYDKEIDNLGAYETEEELCPASTR